MFLNIKKIPFRLEKHANGAVLSYFLYFNLIYKRCEGWFSIRNVAMSWKKLKRQWVDNLFHPRWKWHFTLEFGMWNIQKFWSFSICHISLEWVVNTWTWWKGRNLKLCGWNEPRQLLSYSTFLLLWDHIFLGCSLLHCQCPCERPSLRRASARLLQNVSHGTALCTKLQFSVPVFPLLTINLNRLS